MTFVLCKKGDNHKILSRAQRIYFKGYKKIQADLNITKILKEVNKLKAGVAAVISDNHDLITKAQAIYLSN